MTGNPCPWKRFKRQIALSETHLVVLYNQSSRMFASHPIANWQVCQRHSVIPISRRHDQCHSTRPQLANCAQNCQQCHQRRQFRDHIPAITSHRGRQLAAHEDPAKQAKSMIGSTRLQLPIFCSSGGMTNSQLSMASSLPRPGLVNLMASKRGTLFSFFLCLAGARTPPCK